MAPGSALTRYGPLTDNPVLRRPLESKQYTSIDFTQTLDDHGVLASVGSTGDAYDNAMAESVVDTFKTELIAGRYWTSLEHLEVAIVEWVGWFNHDRLHGEVGDVPPPSSKPSTLPRVPQLSPSEVEKPRNPDSAKPGTAQAAPRCYRSEPPAVAIGEC